MARTKYLHADEVAELLGLSINQIYIRLSTGEMKGYKNKSKWLVNIDQPCFDGYDQQIKEILINAEKDDDIEILSEEVSDPRMNLNVRKVIYAHSDNELLRQLYCSMSDIHSGLHFQLEGVLDCVGDRFDLNPKADKIISE